MEEIKAPKKERKFLKAVGNIAKVLVNELVMGIARKFIGKAIDKVGNKRQGLVIAFALVAGISYASIDSIPYPVTGNKQRLGWQTTGNGLVYRGRSNDTITKPSSYVDKNVKAYLLLDSVRGTIFVWRQTYWDSILVGGGGSFAQPIDSLFFDTSVPTNNVETAKMRWDFDLATVVLGLNDNVPNELGFKNFWLVKNQTGSTITKGSLVYANGTVGASGRITVAKFIANGSIDAKYLLGITAHDLSNGEDGYVISYGKIRQVNTDTFAAGSILYPSPTVAGVWTDVEPIAPNIDMPIGFCINSSSNNGTIAIRVASGYKLSELHDVAISSPVDKASLYYSGGLWRDTTAALLVSDTASMLTPYLRKADTSLLNLTSRFAAKLNISDTSNMLVPYLRKADTSNMLSPYFRDADTSQLNLTSRFNLKLNIADTSAFARDNQISGTSGQVAYFNSSNSVISDAGLIYNATNKLLGINTTTTSGANLIIKNSQEPVRDTFVRTQTFTGTDTTNWTRGAGWTFNGTQAVATAATGNLTYTPSLTVTSGNAYEITYTLTGYTSGTFSVILGNEAAIALPTYNVTGYTVLTLPTNITGGFRFTTSSFTGSLDDVRIIQITGSAPVIFAGQDDGAATLYNSLRMPNSTTLAFGGGGARTTGGNNNFMGNNTGQNNTTGINNNFFGNLAGQNNTTGFGNNFFGRQAGRNNSIGGANNFFGDSAGFNNTTGGNNNFFGSSSGNSNLTGGDNNFFGSNAGFLNTTGTSNNFFGNLAGRSNTIGTSNNFFGTGAGFSNTTGTNNNFFGVNTGRSNTTGSSNIAIGNSSMYNSTVGDTLTGINNIVIGTSSGYNIEFAASNNIAIGNNIEFPVPSGSNQVIIKNIIFATGANGTGTTIAAASKAGIKTNAPNRDLEVAGEVRITDLTTDAPTRLVGADADGDLGQVTLGAGISLASSSLLADTSFLVTRFDTASMLTNYLRSGVAASTYLTQSNAASTYLPLTGGTLTGGLTGTTGTFITNTSPQLILGVNDNNSITKLSFNTGNIERWKMYNTSSVSSITFESLAQLSAARGYRFISSYNTDSNLGLVQDPRGNVGIKSDATGNDVHPNTLYVNGTLGVTGATTLGSSLTVEGATVFGSSSAENDFRVSSGSNLNMIFMDASENKVSIGGTFGVSGATTLSAPLTVNSSAVFNEGSTDSDFRVESDGNANMVFVDASTDRVGIGYASPTKTLDVNGEVRINTVTATPTSLLGKDGSNVVGTVTLGNTLTLTSGTLNVNNKITDINTSSYTIVSNDFYIDNFNSSTTTITLPSAASNTYRELKFHNRSTGALNSSPNVISLTGSSTSSILSASSGKWATLVSDGTDWRIMQAN